MGRSDVRAMAAVTTSTGAGPCECCESIWFGPDVGMMFALSQGKERDFALGGAIMGGKMDQATGRAKEAVGVVSGDEKLEREGKLQRAAGDIKEKASELADDVKKATEKVVDKVKSAIKD